MRKPAATLIYPLMFVALYGCSADAPPPETPSDPPAVVQAAPLTGKAGRANKAAQKKADKKRALKNETMVRRDVMVKPGTD